MGNGTCCLQHLGTENRIRCCRSLAPLLTPFHRDSACSQLPNALGALATIPALKTRRPRTPMQVRGCVDSVPGYCAYTTQKHTLCNLPVAVGAAHIKSFRKAFLSEESRYRFPCGYTYTISLHPKLDFKKHGNGIHSPIYFLFKCVS
jgi:hypothetical protein